jgi:dephospho-CoA kinase
MSPPPRAAILRVGLTGGIASGKSTVARLFAELGADVSDADAIAHRLMEPGGAAHPLVEREFGPEVVRPDGSIDRSALGRIVFADPERRTRLEAILHPLIRAEEAAHVARLAAGGVPRVAVVNAALLVENGFWRDYDRLVVVHCPAEMQVERLMRRDGLAHDAALARIASQMPTAGKLKVAHYAIDTGGDLPETEARAREVFRHLSSELAVLVDGPP